MPLTAPRPATRAAALAPPGGRGFLLLLAATVGAFSNYAPMLSVVPLWSAEGGSRGAGLGAATGVTMAATVAVQCCMARLTARYGARAMFVAGALLLGLPTPLYALSTAMGPVLAVSAVRGAGFGMVAVAGSTLVPALVPAARRGGAVGWYGVATALPQVVCLPLGVWAAGRFGFTAVFAASAVPAVVAAPLVAAVRVPRAAPARAGGRPAGAVAAWRQAAPVAVLAAAACAMGGATSYLPPALGTDTAPLVLFALAAGIVAGRWFAGVWSDRRGTGGLLVPGMAVCAAGVAGWAAAVAVPGCAGLVAPAAGVLYGLGFGVVQNDTLVLMFERAGEGGVASAGSLWNMAYDGGAGVGAPALGLAAAGFGLPGAFTALTALLAAALAPARRTARKPR
ncbi:MFS transporter [Streptomyces sp. NPDC050560]|uniref:MFS transporter n=1 Tax=Streptomyces sp. NPDC050560 TaxID=3365630 RepID=UPI003799C7C0